MGLDTTHNAWHGAYSAFMKWRKEIAYVAGFPPLELMEGFYYENKYNPFRLLDYKYPNGDELDMWALREIKQRLPIKWDLFMDNPLAELLYHSDCDGSISYGKCGRIAFRKEKTSISLINLKNLKMDELFEQMTNISKAHGYDILTEQVKELKSVMRQLIKVCELDDLEITDKNEAANFKNILKKAKILSL